MPMVFVGPVAACLALCVVLAAAGVELALNLTFVGLLFALLLPLTLELRSRTGRPRRVVVIDYRSHHFGHAVWRGLERTLNEEERPWRPRYLTPPADLNGSPQWQAQQLQDAILKDFDAVVLIPAADDQDLWSQLAAAIKSGIFCVVVDTKPPSSVFRSAGIEEPRFVSSRYAATGTLTCGIIGQFLEVAPSRRAVLWTGPEGSWPGEERSRNIVYGLATLGLLDRTELLPMSGWAPDERRDRETLDIIHRMGCEVAVYCGDDENAWSLHFHCLNEFPGLRSQLYIIGCNGTPDDLGAIPVMDHRAVEATINILAEQQGRETAMLMVKERTGKLYASEKSHYITPITMYRSFGPSPWLAPNEDSVVVVQNSLKANEEILSDSDLEDAATPTIVMDENVAELDADLRGAVTTEITPVDSS